MWDSNHVWDPMWPKDAKGIVDDKHILDSIIDKNEVTLKSSGTPVTVWKHYPFGAVCFCNEISDNKPNSKCDVCYGTGFLNGYQKYGYYTYTYGNTSIGRDDRFGITTSNINVLQIPGQDSKALVIASGTSGYIETNWIPLTGIKEHVYLKSRVFTPSNTSITYSCTFNGVDYTTLYNLETDLKLLPLDKTQMKIRATLARNTISTPSPAVNVFKYRCRIKDVYYLYDKRFSILVPAFLASKTVQPRSLKISENGSVVSYPPEWWALPDVKITVRDIGIFLIGNHKNQMFEFQDVETSEHGKNQRVLRTIWKSRFIFSEDDVLGTLYKLD